MARFIDERFTPLLILLLLALAAFAWSRRFMLDDAFISLRYARNLVEGRGLVWNPGERVEGYTNFLWTLVLGLPIALGIDPVAFCYTIGPVLSTLTLYFTARAALVVLESRPLALLAVLLLGTNPSFAAFATGGLETMLAACLQTAVVWFSLRAWRARALSLRAAIALSLTGAAAILTRPDGAIVVGIAFLSVALTVVLADAPGGQRETGTAAGLAGANPAAVPGGRLQGSRVATLAALALPAAVVLSAWLAWKMSFYGRILPNTLSAKVGSTLPWVQGFKYVGRFLASTWTYPFVFVFASGFRRITPPIAALALALVPTFAYMVAVGGDFMEFRPLVPVLPIIVVLIVWTVFVLVTQREIRTALMALAFAGWAHHAATFISAGSVESIPGLADHLTRPGEDWIGIGRRLGSVFKGANDVRIATSASGAIPYYSDLPALDMLGLTDPWIPAHGVEIPGEAGHTWVAPFSYLLEKRVHLVVGHPWIVRTSDPPEMHPLRRGLAGFRYVTIIDPQQLWTGSAILLIPLDAERSLAVLYVTPHPAVEAAIQANHWERIPTPNGGG